MWWIFTWCLSRLDDRLHWEGEREVSLRSPANICFIFVLEILKNLIYTENLKLFSSGNKKAFFNQHHWQAASAFCILLSMRINVNVTCQHKHQLSEKEKQLRLKASKVPQFKNHCQHQNQCKNHCQHDNQPLMLGGCIKSPSAFASSGSQYHE